MSIVSETISLESWMERLNSIREQITEFDKEKEGWDRLSYFSKVLYMGQALVNVSNSGFQWLSNTKHGEQIPIEKYKELYELSKNVTLSLTNEFYSIINGERERKAKQEKLPGFVF